MKAQVGAPYLCEVTPCALSWMNHWIEMYSSPPFKEQEENPRNPVSASLPIFRSLQRFHTALIRQKLI